MLAQEESRLLGHESVGTEHVLLGLVHEGHGLAVQALHSLDVDLDRVRTTVQDMIGQGPGTPPGQVPFTPGAKKALEMALREALDLGHNYIGTEHLLLGLLREGEGVAAQVLTQLGLELGEVRDELMRLVSPHVRRPAAPVSAEGRAETSHPLCSGCGIDLEGRMGTRSLTATSDDGGGLVPVVIVYCRGCGRSLAVLPGTSATPPST